MKAFSPCLHPRPPPNCQSEVRTRGSKESELRGAGERQTYTEEGTEVHGPLLPDPTSAPSLQVQINYSQAFHYSYFIINNNSQYINKSSPWAGVNWGMELLLKGDVWLFQRPAKTPCSCLFAHLILVTLHSRALDLKL